MPRVSVLLILVAGVGVAAHPQRVGSGVASVTPVLGRWEAGAEAGTPIVTADARRWDGKPPGDPDSLARTLFRSETAPFRANVTSPNAFPLAVFDNIPSFAGGTLRVDFKLIGGESDQIAGLVFDLRPTGEYLYVRYNTRDDNVALWRFRNGNREVLAHGEAHRRLVLNAWHTLTLHVKGPAIRAVAAGDLSVNFELPEPVSGRTGAWTKRDSVTAFRAWQAATQ